MSVWIEPRVEPNTVWPMNLFACCAALLVATIFVFDPVGFFGLRPIAFVFCVFFGFPLLIMRSIAIRSLFFLFIFVVLVPIWGLLLFSLFSSGPLKDTSYIAFSALLGYAGFFARDRHFRLARAVTFLSSTLIASLIFYCNSIMIATGSNDTLSFFTTSSIAVLGFRDYGPITLPYVFVISSPLLILGCAMMAFDKSVKRPTAVVFFGLFFVALFLSGTRSHQAISCILLLLFFFSRYGKAIGTVASVAVIVVMLGYAMTLIFEMLSLNESNNHQKLSMFSSYAEIFNNPATLVFGQGFNASTWSSELRQIVSLEIGATKTELTYVEIFRVFGFPISFLILGALFFLLSDSEKQGGGPDWLRIGIGLQLLNASINAYLFSFNGAFGLGMLLGLLWQRRQLPRKDSGTERSFKSVGRVRGRVVSQDYGS